MLKTLIVLVFSLLMTGCVAVPGTYAYDSGLYVGVDYGTTVYYRDRGPRLSRSTHYYTADQHEIRTGRCDLPGYFYNGYDRYCEHTSIRRNDRIYHRRGDIHRFPNCDRYYRGHLLPPGRYYCR